MNRHSRITMRLPVAVAVSILVSPLATILAWCSILRRRDLTPPRKGVWIVLCLLPILGPLLYLGIGQGRLELIFDKITGSFAAAVLVLLLVVRANRTSGSSNVTWHISIPAGTILYIPGFVSLLAILLFIVGCFFALEWLFGLAIARGRTRGA